MSQKLHAMFYIMKGTLPQSTIDQAGNTTAADDWLQINDVDKDGTLNFYIYDETSAHLATSSEATVLVNSSTQLKLRFAFGGSIGNQDVVIKKCSKSGGTGHLVDFSAITVNDAFYELGFKVGEQVIVVSGFRNQ